MKTSKWAKQFAEIIRAEPRVLDLLGEAARVDASGKHWCANAFFYDKIKPRLTDLIGWDRGHKDGPAVCRLREKSPLGIVNMLEWSRDLDALELLRAKAAAWSKSASLVYLDPPYYVKGSSRLYTDFYQEAQHEALARRLARARFHWVVSYDDNPEVRRLYRGFRARRATLEYSASKRSLGREVLHFAGRTRIPSGAATESITRERRGSR